MFQKILLCTDGSDQAFSAANLAADLASRLNAHVDLVHVLDPVIASQPSAFVPEAILSAEITLGYAQERQQGILNRTSHVLEQAHVSYQSYAELGHPVERILCIAEEDKADLIVMGSRGSSTWSLLLLGSVSEGVARHAACPVLIVRGEPKGFHEIVIASDGSEGAGRAVRAGMELARDYHADVSILHVFQPRVSYAGASREDLNPEVHAVRVQEAIARQVEPIARETGVSYRLCQEQGHPAETLAGFAEKQKADLIVVGSRGLGGFQRLLLGSVSTSVLHHAQCSIMVAR